MRWPILLCVRIRVEKAMDVLRQRQTDTGGLSEGLHRCQLNGVNGVEMGQQIFHPLWTDAWNIGETGTFHPLTTLLSMETHRKAMGLIA